MAARHLDLKPKVLKTWEVLNFQYREEPNWTPFCSAKLGDASSIVAQTMGWCKSDILVALPSFSKPMAPMTNLFWHNRWSGHSASQYVCAKHRYHQRYQDGKWLTYAARTHTHTLSLFFIPPPPNQKAPFRRRVFSLYSSANSHLCLKRAWVFLYFFCLVVSSIYCLLECHPSLHLIERKVHYFISQAHQKKKELLTVSHTGRHPLDQFQRCVKELWEVQYKILWMWHQCCIARVRAWQLATWPNPPPQDVFVSHSFCSVFFWQLHHPSVSIALNPHLKVNKHWVLLSRSCNYIS